MDYKQRCKYLENRIKHLNLIGIALSTEDDLDKLFEMIMDEAKHITNADGRTLYMKSDDGNNLNFEILLNDSMGSAMGGTSGNKVTLPPVRLFNEKSHPNESNVAAYVANTGKTVNISDAYKEDGFDFSGTKSFDKITGYRSKSFLTVPLKNHENEIIGVMQLINSIDSKSNKPVSFSNEMQTQIESLCSQGAVALTNKRLVQELKTLFEAFIQLIAKAIDEKSEYTGGHCERVPEITMMLADAVEKVDYGKYKDFSMTEEERYELYIAGWLHDCGKVATPPHIVDKGTKLETIFDRIETVQTRFEVLKRDIEIKYLKEKINRLENGQTQPSNSDYQLEKDLEVVDQERIIVEKANIGGEFMDKEEQDKIKKIANKYSWINSGKKEPFLSDKEVENLCIPKGTLLPEEREIINDHIRITIDMLEKLPYPKHLKNVPEFAGGHHEKLDGTGYPKGLKAHEMSVQAKMMAIADIFEALTAADRPYKDGKKLSQAMRIMGFMKDDYHIDKDLFEIFVKEGVYRKYADKYVKKNQIDKVDELKVLD
ncbi:MAG: phosphohydrolase [Candidatus Marinimicrobia bacterium]|nr:phosphohydrolase [Candidatus Neomarinimicrobiota bacterium]